MICKLFGLSYCLIGLKGLLVVDRRIGPLVDCCLVFSLLYGMMYGMLFICYLVRRLVCTLLGVLASADVPSVVTETANCVLLALLVLSKAKVPPTISDVPL